MINIGISSLILSIWAVLLFFGKSIGLSMLLFIIPFTYYMLHLLEKNNKIKNAKAKILIIPISLLSSTYLIFNNTFFNKLNIFIIPILLVLMLIGLLNEKIIIQRIIESVLGIILEPISYIGETLNKIKNETKEKFGIKINKEKDFSKIIKAVCITIPIVLVIIGLLASADQVFENIFVNILNIVFGILGEIKVSDFVVRIVVTICVFIYLSSLFYSIVSKDNGEMGEEILAERKYNDNITIKMILGALNLIYLLFCIIQIKSLFIRDVNINYSQYARQGFFQLMIVSFINLITILVAKKREKEELVKENKYINLMCLIMIIFTFIIVISSAVRMYFYESYYGYTLLRLLVYWALFTESLLLIPTILYILDRKINLPKTYFIIITCMYLCINFINIDSIIAKRNVDRYIETGKIDMQYLRDNMGTDATPQIMRILETSTDIDNVKKESREYLKQQYQEINDNKMDFRNFNISIIFAKKIIKKRII